MFLIYIAIISIGTSLFIVSIDLSIFCIAFIIKSLCLVFVIIFSASIFILFKLNKFAISLYNSLIPSFFNAEIFTIFLFNFCILSISLSFCCKSVLFNTTIAFLFFIV